MPKIHYASDYAAAVAAVYKCAVNSNLFNLDNNNIEVHRFKDTYI